MIDLIDFLSINFAYRIKVVIKIQMFISIMYINNTLIILGDKKIDFIDFYWFLLIFASIQKSPLKYAKTKPNFGAFFTQPDKVFTV